MSRYCNPRYCDTNHNQDWTRRCRMTWLLHKPDSFGHDRYRTCSYQLLIWARMRYRTTHNGGQPSIGRRMSSVRSTCQKNPGAHRACIDPGICPFCSAPHCFPNNHGSRYPNNRSGSRHPDRQMMTHPVDMDTPHDSTTRQKENRTERAICKRGNRK